MPRLALAGSGAERDATGRVPVADRKLVGDDLDKAPAYGRDQGGAEVPAGSEQDQRRGRAGRGAGSDGGSG
ncbi:MAG: hypothetical protein KF817_01355 [Phycisphaeraceae bacterium]|nr:hypothetical protein [Phycisphaeraceae bacterium]